MKTRPAVRGCWDGIREAAAETGLKSGRDFKPQSHLHSESGSRL
jgi:hypothetical protein